MEIGPVDQLLAKLPDARRTGDGWVALCPAHEDRRPSLSVSEGDDGRALVKCHAGCSTEAVVGAVGLGLRDLMPLSSKKSYSRKGEETHSKKAKLRRVFATARNAVAELERALGARSAMWPYHNSDGEPVGVIVRWDTPTEKDIRAASFDAARGGWVLAGMSQPRPLYRLPELTDAGRIFVTEGEKAADAARALGLGATTSPHGSNGATKTDWSPLAGKQVVILPDHDKAGENYAEM